MLKIDGKEVVLNYNKGFIGAFEYNNIFKRSLTDDIIKCVNDGNPDNIVYDLVTFLRIVYLLGGYTKKLNFNDFINKIPQDYNFMDDFIDVLEKACEIYLPTKSPEKENNQDKE